MIASLLAAALALPANAATVKLFAFDEEGRYLDREGLLRRLSRADEKAALDPSRAAFWAEPVEPGRAPVRAKLEQTDRLLTASWPGGPAVLRLVWPVREDGYSGVAADNGGHGFADGASVYLEEEIALTEYRLFKRSWLRRTSETQPPYRPSPEAQRLADAARDAVAEAQRGTEAPQRAAGFEKALRAIALAWEKALAEHGRQRAREAGLARAARFGLTLDDSLLQRLDDLDWIAEAVSRSGSNWARLVFRPNPDDFPYAAQSSFSEYDAAVKALRRRNLKVLGCVLDTAQWPRSLTPEAYAARVKNLALHFKGLVDAWEVGSELNGDWLGGARAPLTPEQVFQIYSAGAKSARAAAPGTELMATLYWWEETAPDREHSLSGWLKTYAPQGFGRDVDVVGLELFPEDNPVGLSFERAFEEAAAALPDAKLMLSSFGYVEKDELQGYWWLAPDDVDGARKDLMTLFLPASCAMTRSLCGGFWWQTLDQMLPAGHRVASDLYRVYRLSLLSLGRR